MLSMMQPYRLRWLLMATIAFVLYVGSYFAYRASHIEVWERNGQPYVIFPVSSPVVYYVYRPLTYLDGALTGMGFHIGPHQE